MTRQRDIVETPSLALSVILFFADAPTAWLVTGSINATYVVPATCRLFLIMACDLTFVLARSFKEVTFRANGQPNEKDVAAAARNYRLRGYSQHVHRHIKHLVPRRNLAASYKVEKIRQGVDDLFMAYKDKLMEDENLPLKVEGLKIGSDPFADPDDDTSTDAGSSLDSATLDGLDGDIVYAKRAFTNLEASSGGAVEMDASEPMVELPADSEPSELPGDSKAIEHTLGLSRSKTKRYEMEA